MIFTSKFTASEAEKGGGGVEEATAPPMMFLEGHCPLKNYQSRDTVLYLKFVVLNGQEECVSCN